MARGQGGHQCVARDRPEMRTRSGQQRPKVRVRGKTVVCRKSENIFFLTFLQILELLENYYQFYLKRKQLPNKLL